MPFPRRCAAAAALTAAGLALTACTAPTTAGHSSASGSASTPVTTSAAPSPTSLTITVPASSTPPTTHARRRTPAPSSGAPVIVLDPGHSRPISAIDPSTGLDVSDYANEPEMRDVFAVAELVRARLAADGYRVVLTKKTVDQRVSLGQRAAIARAAHADLAVSIHDQAGGNGGIGFRAGNNTVYYQSTGTYRSTPSGKKIYFTNERIAALSKKYGRIFQQQRNRVEGSSIQLQGDTGYNLGGRGLASGDIWMVQLLGGVPWIYNESGGNSAGRTGLSAADQRTYADALVAGVEHCIAPPR